MTTPQPIPPSSSSLRSLRLLLQYHSRRSAQNVDTFVLRLQKLFSTPSGTDTSLATLGYSLTLLHAFLHHRLESKLTTLAEAVAEKASEALLPGETLIATIPPPPEYAALARRTDATKKMASLISDYRIFVRLWGLLGLYKWGRDTWLDPPTDTVLKTVTWAQVWVNVAFQFLENGAYLAQHGVLNGDGWRGEKGAKRQTTWWLWSARFWASHVVLDAFRLGYLVYKERKQVEEEGGDEKEKKIAKANAVAAWWKAAVCNAAYAPLTVHWSLEEGILSEAAVGALGTTAGLAGLRLLWKATA